MTTIDDVRAFLDAKAFDLAPDTPAETGVLHRIDGAEVPYEIHHGWSLPLAHACDRDWKQFNIALMKFVKDQNYDAAKLAVVLSKIQIDDDHWDWLTKACVYRSAEYEWFFLVAENKPQGACLIYHPKPSVLSTGNIFYIEYIAVAPWNRDNPMESRRFRAIGSVLIKHAVQHSHQQLKLRYGFSLHAIPRAAAFYAKIGMTPHPKADKDPLIYFEMIEANAAAYAVKA